MTAELPKLPKCPKCGREPEWWSYYAKGGDAWGISLMCGCYEISGSVPFEQIPHLSTYGMRLNRCKVKMIREWKEYVKEQSHEEVPEVRTDAKVGLRNNPRRQ